MIDNPQMSNAVSALITHWLRECPSRPLVLRADPRHGSVEAQIGLSTQAQRVTGRQAAEILGISYRTLSRAHFFGLQRGSDHRYSRLSVERLRDRRAS
jgi:hypothetical protein